MRRPSARSWHDPHASSRARSSCYFVCARVASFSGLGLPTALARVLRYSARLSRRYALIESLTTSFLVATAAAAMLVVLPRRVNARACI
jgi:hypothetical protein